MQERCMGRIACHPRFQEAPTRVQLAIIPQAKLQAGVTGNDAVTVPEQ